jgi:hypothetical protein
MRDEREDERALEESRRSIGHDWVKHLARRQLGSGSPPDAAPKATVA